MAVTALTFGLLTAQTAHAQDSTDFPVTVPVPIQSQLQTLAPADAGLVLPTWERTLYKTLTYQAVANLSDIVLYNVLIGGSATTAGTFFAANALSAAALYYGFEYTWQSVGPRLEDTNEGTLAEKTVLYRVLNSSRNFALGLTFGGSAAAAGAFVVANFVTDTVIFVGNEYVWDILGQTTTEGIAE
jgi:uncharacterized membrane protein